MTSTTATSGWTQVGQSRTSPVENKKRAEVALDSYYLVIGFEVNSPKAFVNEVQDLAVDYGHAFFYLVRNTKIVKLFSFGPVGLGKTGWFGKGGHAPFESRNIYNVGAFLKDGSMNSRPATPDYPISELVKAFRIPLSLAQAKALEAMTDKFRAEVLDGEIRYNAMVNDTCAVTAKKVLDSAAIPTPSGRSLIKHSGILNYPLLPAVNPYKWHEDFKGKYRESSYQVTSRFGGGWIPAPGDDDPIFGVPDFAKKDPIFGVAL